MSQIQAAKLIAFMVVTAFLARSQDVASEIRVKVLDGWSGKPFVNVETMLVEASGEIGSGLPTQVIVRETRSRTDHEGMVRFKLSRPFPNRIRFDFYALRACMPTWAYMKRNHWKISPGEWKPEEILRSGYREEDACLLGVKHTKF